MTEPQETKFAYHIDQTNMRLVRIEDKIDSLMSFRFMLIGMSLAVSVISSGLLNILFIFIGHK